MSKKIKKDKKSEKNTANKAVKLKFILVLDHKFIFLVFFSTFVKKLFLHF